MRRGADALLADPAPGTKESYMPERSPGTRVVALVGPGGAGKTSLAEALLFTAGAIDRQGSTSSGNSIGDSSPEARSRGSIRGLLEALQPLSRIPIMAREIPIRDGERISGFVDLALERAFLYRPGQPSERSEIPPDLAAREAEDRFHMLETLADHDDTLLEQLLMDETPDLQIVLADLARETREMLSIPLFFGSALNGFGVRRLQKALRHEAPGPEVAAARLGAERSC